MEMVGDATKADAVATKTRENNKDKSIAVVNVVVAMMMMMGVCYATICVIAVCNPPIIQQRKV
jgi:hypothetical protein